MDDWIGKGLAGLAGVMGGGGWARWLLNKRDERISRLENEYEGLKDHLNQYYMPAKQIRSEFIRIEGRIDKGQDETRADIKGIADKIDKGFQRLHDKLDGKADK